jgi:hypothetical protein
MPGPDFFQTTMGRRFYESDVPKIARSLDKLADALAEFVQMHQIVSKIPTEKEATESAMALNRARMILDSNLETLQYLKKTHESWHKSFLHQGAVPYDEAKSTLLILQRILKKGFINEEGRD